MDAFFKDLKHSLRMFGKNPAFTVAALAALALGIGTNTAIFSVVNAVLLKPVPFSEPDRLVMFMNTSPQGSGTAASPAKFAHWQQQTSVVQDVSAFRNGVVNYTGGEFPEQIRSSQVSRDYFRMLGAPIIRGRSFSPAEDRPKGEKVVVLSHGLWVRRFASDPEVIGKSISLSGLPVSNVRTMNEIVSISTSRQRFNMVLMTVFGGSALLLAAIGIYGLMAYSVQQRSQEIGIRMALGAEPGGVRKMVVFQGMRLTLVGVVIGIASAFGLTRFISTFLFGVQARDPMVFVGIPILLSLVALVAVWLPARRASRVDPVIALRYE